MVTDLVKWAFFFSLKEAIVIFMWLRKCISMNSLVNSHRNCGIKIDRNIVQEILNTIF